MAELYDIAIVGLGPAGATLARLISKDFKVLCIDRKKPDSEDSMEGFTKPCGGLIAPDAQRELASMGLNIPLSVLADPQTFSVKTVDLKSGLTRDYPRDYINANRHRFDMWLVSLIQGADILFESRVDSITRQDGVFRLTIQTPDGQREASARRIVGADGAGSIVRRLFFNKKIRQYVAIQNWYEGVKNPRYCSFFDERLTDCYAWSKPQDGFTVIGAALPKNKPGERFNTLLERIMPHGFEPLGDPVKVEACLVDRPAGFFDYCLEKDGAFLLGEAAGFISPSSLEGISLALKSARALASALRTPHPGRTYRRKALKLKIKTTAKLLKVPFMYWPWLRRLVMASGLTSLDIVE